MIARNTWRKPAPPGPGGTSAAVVAMRVLSVSVLAWLLLGAAGLLFATTGRVTDAFELSFFPDGATGSHTLRACAFLLAVGGLTGALCSLPASALLLLGNRAGEMIQRKPGRLKLLQRAFGRVFPYLVLGLTHFGMIALGLGAAPQWARSLTRDPNALADASRFVNDLVYHPAENESTRDAWKRALTGPAAPRAFTVFAPASLLSHATGLPRLKRVLGEPPRFFADSASAPAFFAELFYEEESANLAFHLPVADEFALRGMGRFLREYGPNLGVSWDARAARPADLVVDFAPEWEAVERTITGRGDPVEAALRRRTALSIRLMQSQPHLFALARTDLFRAFEPAARWTTLVADDVATVEAVLSELGAKGAGLPADAPRGRGLAFAQLSELERGAGDVTPPVSPLRWPDSLSPSEQRWLSNRFDSLLGFGFAVASGPGAPALLVVPYPDGEVRSQITGSFARARGGEGVESVLPAKLKSGFLTVDDVSLVIRNSQDLPAARRSMSPSKGRAPGPGAPGGPVEGNAAGATVAMANGAAGTLATGPSGSADAGGGASGGRLEGSAGGAGSGSWGGSGSGSSGGAGGLPESAASRETAGTAQGAAGSAGGDEQGLHCERHFADLSSLLSDEDVPGRLIRRSYWNAVGRYSGERFEFPSALGFLSGSGFEHGVICRPSRSADGRSFDTSQNWIVRWVRQDESEILLSPRTGGLASPRGDAAGALRSSLVRIEGDGKRRADARPPHRAPRQGGKAPENEAVRARYADLELFRLAPDPQSGMILRRATPVEAVEFFKRWGPRVSEQFELGARAQLH